MAIHPSAIVDPRARIASSADIGPYCCIGPDVVIGEHTQLISHVVIENRTQLGDSNVVHPFARLGGIPQDKKFKGEPGTLIIGDHNTIRESVTINIGTQGGQMLTRVGSRCLFMASVHIAHDCDVGNEVIIANCTGLAGHVKVADNANLGGLVGVHQFCRIGRYAFVGAGSMVAFDIPPFCMAQGDRANLAGLNIIGLRRAGFNRDEITTLYRAYVKLFHSRVPHLTALEHLLAQPCVVASVGELCDFIATAKRGVTPARERHQQVRKAAQVKLNVHTG